MSPARKPKRTLVHRRAQDDRVERRRATIRGRISRLPMPPAGGPADIPSEARMLRNLEREWGMAEPGSPGRILDAEATGGADFD